MFNWLKKTFIAPAKAPHQAAATDPENGPATQSGLRNESVSFKNCGDQYLEQGKLEDAVKCYRQAIAINQGYAEAYNNLGNALREQQLYEGAARCFEQAVSINPELVNAYYNLGSMLQEQGRLDEAMENLSHAIAIKPDFADAYNLMGIVSKGQGKPGEAVSYFRQALEYEPDCNVVRAQMLHQLQQMCEWKDLESSIHELRKVVQEAPVAYKNCLPPFTFLAMPGVTADEQKRCAERYVQVEYQPLAHLRKKLRFEFGRAPGKKISLGYLSADFRQHPVSFLMAGVFELHDRNRFHITAYSYGPDDGSEMRKRLENAFDKFEDIRGDSHEIAARKIYEDHIDILVDLTGYTTNARSAILSLRPAPIQVNYLGYPGTMGAEFIDYLIADRFIIPPEQRKHYTEKVMWLPDCYMPSDRSRLRPVAPTNRKDCGLPENALIFCCFNQPYKITPEIFNIWCRLLKAVPGSILWLPSSNPHAENSLLREAEKRGVEAERIVITPKLGRIEAHLARLQCADLFLDTLPFNAHTTCGDALWMGLPVVTCAGDTFSSRVAGSLLTAMDVPELITCNLEDYYSLALDLATDKDKRENIRNKIIANRDITPLFDNMRFTRNLEAAYTQMLDDHARSIDVQ